MPSMDALTLYGAFAVTAMLIFYALEERAAVFVLAFAGACLASSAYGFLQGAWPFGVVELIWSGSPCDAGICADGQRLAGQALLVCLGLGRPRRRC